MADSFLLKYSRGLGKNENGRVVSLEKTDKTDSLEILYKMSLLNLKRSTLDTMILIGIYQYRECTYSFICQKILFFMPSYWKFIVPTSELFFFKN